MPFRKYASLASITNLLLDAICVVDAEGHYVYVSAAFERIFGYSPEEVIGKAMIDLVAPEDKESTLRIARQVMSGNPIHHFENRYVRKDGQIVHVLWTATWSESEKIRVGVAHDITARKRAEAKQAAIYAISEAAHRADDLQALFLYMHQIIGTMLPTENFTVALYEDSDSKLSFPYHFHDSNLDPQSGREAAEIISSEVIRTGRPLLIFPEDAGSLLDHWHALAKCEGGGWLGTPLTTPKGLIGALTLKSPAGGIRYTDADKDLLHFVSTQVAAAVERQQLYCRLQQMAQYDELTKLANRRLLRDRLKASLANAKREQGRFALLFLDLNRFKQVNDIFGHSIGDLLLQEVAVRLRKCVRETDTVARVGGDEFVVLLQSIKEPGHALIVEEKIRDVLREPLMFEGNALEILVSIGIAHYPEHGDSVEQLFKHADFAMYKEKSLINQHSVLLSKASEDGKAL